MTRLILSIDLGTSGPKVGLFDLAGHSEGCAFEEIPLLTGAGGTAEQSPSDWWQAIVRTTRKALSSSAASVGRIGAIAVTAQWSGTVPVDREGRPLANAIIWMDTRGARYVREITGGFPSIEGYGLLPLVDWIRLTGGIPAHSGKDSLAHILYLKRERPEIHRETWKYLEPKDYINMVLTGRTAASYDSIGLHWVCDTRNRNRIDYHPRLLRRAGLEREKLPDLCDALNILGPILPDRAAELGLPAGLPVVCGSPDLHSAAVGSGAVRDREGHLYLGTSSWIVSHVPFKKTDLLHNMATLISPIPNRYFIANEQETSGQCLKFLINNLLFPESDPSTRNTDGMYAHCNTLASTVPPGSNGLIFTPWLVGERTPVENATIRGGFHNLSLNHTRAEMIRSVMEGVALNLRWLLGHVEAFQKQAFPYLNLIGGGARSDLWSQILADVLDRPMRRVKAPVEANARGAAWIAATALGWMDFNQIAEKVTIDRVFEPRPEHRDLYARIFREFLNIYNNDAHIHSRLNSRELSRRLTQDPG